MKNCTNCGSAMDDNAAFCANCGTPVAPAQPIAPEPPVVEMQQNTYQTNPNQNPYQTNPAPTYNQHGGYNPYAQPTQSMNIPGLVGFILALIGLFIFWIPIYGLIPAVVALILSIVGLTQIKKTGQNGKGLALAGVIIGALATVIGIIYLIYWIAVLSGLYYYY